MRRRKLKGKWSRETCYAVTSLTVTQATHAQLAAIIRGHGTSRTGCTVPATWTSTKTAPRSAPRPARASWPAYLAITILRLSGAASIAAALRYHARQPRRPLRTIMRC